MEISTTATTSLSPDIDRRTSTLGKQQAPQPQPQSSIRCSCYSCYRTVRFRWYQLLLIVIGFVSLSYRVGSICGIIWIHHYDCYDYYYYYHHHETYPSSLLRPFLCSTSDETPVTQTSSAHIGTETDLESEHGCCCCWNPLIVDDVREDDQHHSCYLLLYNDNIDSTTSGTTTGSSSATSTTGSASSNNNNNDSRHRSGCSVVDYNEMEDEYGRRHRRMMTATEGDASIRQPKPLLPLVTVGEKNEDVDSVSHTATTEVWYEAMVHPSLLVHPEPFRVIIIYDHHHSSSSSGGRGGPILQQVLLHTLVKEVLYIVPVITSPLLQLSLSNNDPRIKLISTNDPISYLRQQQQQQQQSYDHGLDPSTTTTTTAKMDVVFVDISTYPNITNPNFLFMVDSILGECGMLVCHIGRTETMNDLPVSLLQHNDEMNHWVGLIDAIRHQTNDFHNIVDYNEYQHKFVIGMKCRQCRSNWIWNEAEFQIQIVKRMTRSRTDIDTTDDNDDMLHFDAATMMNYQFPSRIAEEVWCRNELENDDGADNDDEDNDGVSCAGRHGYDPEIFNVPLSSLIVNTSLVANGGRGVFAAQPIPMGSTIILEECVQGMMIPISTMDLLYTAVSTPAMTNSTDFWNVVAVRFIDGYGWSERFLGGANLGGVDTSILTFMNHGCYGLYNIGPKMSFHEMNVIQTTMECDDDDDDDDDDDTCRNTTLRRTCPDGQQQQQGHMYDPYRERQYPMWGCDAEVTNRYIDIGEELLLDYMCLGGSDFFNETIIELQSMCDGGVGFVSQYEDDVLIASVSSPSNQ